MTIIFSLESIISLAVAAALGGLLGLEREIHGRPAGLRTHLLVSLGAAAFMLMSPIVAAMSQATLGDPGRIAAQIVTGIGFLGAGAIVKEGVNIRGLTTAACLWVAAAIGMASGASLFAEALLVFGLAMFALILLPTVEVLLKRHSYRVLEITLPIDSDPNSILDIIQNEDTLVIRSDLVRDYKKGVTKTTLILRLYHRGVADKQAHTIIKRIEDLELQPVEIIWRPR